MDDKSLTESKQSMVCTTQGIRRENVRFPTDFEVALWNYVRLDWKGKFNIGFVQNISLGGFFVEVDGDPLEVGTHIEFEFYLPKYRLPVKGVARIAWVHPKQNGMGVKFEKLHDDSENVLFDFIENMWTKSGYQSIP